MDIFLIYVWMVCEVVDDVLSSEEEVIVVFCKDVVSVVLDV